MAISPDMPPITATCPALVLGRWGLAGRALATLAVGLAVAGLVAGAATFVLNAVGLLSSGFEVGDSAVEGLQTVNISTPIVALDAGVAGMVAGELGGRRRDLGDDHPGVGVPRRGDRRGGRGKGVGALLVLAIMSRCWSWAAARRFPCSARMQGGHRNHSLAPKLTRAPALYGSLGSAATLLLWLFLIARIMVASAFVNTALWRRSSGAGAT